MLTLHRGGPVHAAVVLGQAAAEAGQLLEVALARTCAFVVGLAGDDAAAVGDQCQRAREQGTGLLALARRQHQHQRVAALAGHIIQLAADGPAGGLLQWLRERGKALLAMHFAVAGHFAQRPAVAGPQESHGAFRPAQGALGERQEQGLQGGVVAGGHRRGYFKREGRPLYRLDRVGPGSRFAKPERGLDLPATLERSG